MALQVKVLSSPVELKKFLDDTDFVHADADGHTASPLAKTDIVSIYFDSENAKHVVVYDEGA